MMDPRVRILSDLLLEKMEKNPEFSKKLGLADVSTYKTIPQKQQGKINATASKMENNNC